MLVTIWEIFNDGAVPYSSKSNREVAEYIKGGGKINQLKCSDDIYKIILACTADLPEERPSFENLLQKLKVFAPQTPEPETQGPTGEEFAQKYSYFNEYESV